MFQTQSFSKNIKINHNADDKIRDEKLQYNTQGNLINTNIV